MESITGGLVAMIVILAVMSVCMYFIMRSSLMSRIKEVGIYRAIGVSKKNLVFKFLTEAFVLATLTVFLGYLATSAFLFACMSMSGLVSSVFYYPVWLAGAVLALLYALSLVCGVLPILSLLRKTPSEILAKYDI
jgi:ABC-type antimicrobial peptide transport system permease subunit